MPDEIYFEMWGRINKGPWGLVARQKNSLTELIPPDGYSGGSFEYVTRLVDADGIVIEHRGSEVLPAECETGTDET